MAVTLIVLGLPGSGKSGVARYIATYIRDKGWESTHFNDYAILKKMFQDDAEHKQFRSADHGGFDVIDFSVIDTALQKLEQIVNQHLLSAKQEEIVVIEFARNDYQRAFKQFTKAFLQGAYFLYLDATINTCKRRICERITDPKTDDDYYVSEYIFGRYYNKDDGQCIPHILEEDYGIDNKRVMFIDNNCSLKEASRDINPIVDTIIDPKSADVGLLYQSKELFVSV